MNQPLFFVSAAQLVLFKYFLDLIDLQHKKYFMCFKTFDQTDLPPCYQCGSQENKVKKNCKTPYL